MKICVHTLVCNEENYLWYAVMSVVDFVDKVLIWDTGSTDKTVEIINQIIKVKGDKVEFRELGPVDKEEFTQIRQKMLDQSKCDWVLIVDGDEVWLEDSLRKLTDAIQNQGDQLQAIAVPFYSLVGDVYHYQEEEAGKYQLLGKKGHLTIRAINAKIPGLHTKNPYGSEGYFDGKEKPIQELGEGKVVFLEAPYFHFTHLKRSSSKMWVKKYKHELGKAFPEDFSFPQILYKEGPLGGFNPWNKRGKRYILISLLCWPLIRLKRAIFR